MVTLGHTCEPAVRVAALGPHLSHDSSEAALPEHGALPAHVGSAQHHKRGGATLRRASEHNVVRDKGAAPARDACGEQSYPVREYIGLRGI